MNLHDYFASPDALTVSELAALVHVSVTQMRQWVHGYAGRIPRPANCVAIEVATDRRVTRPDLRPGDWRDIWPELIPLYPAVPAIKAAVLLSADMDLVDRRDGPLERRFVNLPTDGPDQRVAVEPRRAVDRQPKDISSTGQGG